MVSLHLCLCMCLLIALECRKACSDDEVPDEKSSQTLLFTKTTVFERVSHLYDNPVTSDIKFTCGINCVGKEFYAHKYVLAWSSPVFYERFYGDSLENNVNTASIDLSEINDVTLAAFLSFLYKDECPADAAEGFKVLQLAKKYQISSFAIACKDYLGPEITAHEAFKMIEEFLESKAEAMADFCWKHIDAVPNDFFSSEDFLNIQKSTLDALLERDTLCCDEMTVYKAVVKWLDHQCRVKGMEPTRDNRRTILGDSIYKIRFLVIEQKEFIDRVAGQELLTDAEGMAMVKFLNGQQVPDLKWDDTMSKREGSCERSLLSDISSDIQLLWFIIITPKTSIHNFYTNLSLSGKMLYFYTNLSPNGKIFCCTVIGIFLFLIILKTFLGLIQPG